MKYYLTILLGLLWPSLFFAQILYPVKIDHKWGYIDYLGNVLVEPKYDLLDTKELPYHSWTPDSISEFKLVELNKKLGLTDGRKQEVLRPAYQQIRPLSQHFFAVKIDSLFTVVNRNGEVLIDDRFEDIRIMDRNQSDGNIFFKVKIGEYWGVYQANKGLTLPGEYDDIELVNAKLKYFKVKKASIEGGWGMVNGNNKIILPFQFNAIEGYHSNFIATKTNFHSLWQVRDSLGNPHLDSLWTSFLPLNSQLIQMKDSSNRVHLYAFAKGDTLNITRRFATYAPLNEDYILGLFNRRFAILDNNGQEILPPDYTDIKPFTLPGYLRVRKNFFWGVYQIGQGEVLKPDYDYINSFQDGYAKVSRSRREGIINSNFEEIIPPTFDSIKRDSNFFKGYNRNRLSVFEMGTDGQVKGVEDFSQVFTLKVGAQRNYSGPPMEAKPIKRKDKAINEARFMEDHPSPLVLDGTPWQWKYDRKEKHWGLIKEVANREDSIISKPIFRTVQHIKKTKLSLVFSYEDPESGRVAITAGTPGESFCKLAIFGHDQGKMLTGFTFAGIRRHDFERGLPCAAALKQNGYFGLVDTAGELLKGEDGQPLELSYIGEFVDGYARACKGGKIRKVETPSENKFSVENRYLLWQKFGLTNPLVKSFSQEVRLLVDSNRMEVPQWGFIDTLGKWAIPPIYEYARDFDKGQAVAVKDDNWGVIDHSNRVIIDFQYASISSYYGKWRISQKSDQTLFFNQRGWQILIANYDGRGNFSEGFCRVRKGDQWAFINERGELITPFQYDQARDFSGGLAAVKHQGKWNFIDTSGQMAINTMHLDIPIDTVSNFYDGLCWFKSGRKYGFLNKNGEVAIEPKFPKVFDFQHGVARVVDLVDSVGFKTGLINTVGKYILKPNSFERIYPFNEYGLAKVMEAFSAHEYGLIDTKGNLLAPIKYHDIQDFSEGFATVRIAKAYGLINRKGEEVIPLEYRKVGTMSEGRVGVMPTTPTKWEYLDTLGQSAFEGYYDIITPFSKGYAEVTKNMFDPQSQRFIDLNGEEIKFKKGQVQFYQEGIFGMYAPSPPEKGQHYYYADTDGNNIFDRHFQAIDPFEGGIATITKSWRRGVVNKRGLTIIHPKYFFLQILEDGNILVRPPAFGVADRSGKVLIPPIYDQIQYMSGQIYRVEQGEKVGYLTYTGKWIWELKN